jgi:hypothetical protein
MRLTRAGRPGTVGVNSYRRKPNAPFGFRRSGLGGPGGRAPAGSGAEPKTFPLPLADEMT